MLSLAHFLRSLGLPKGLVVGAQELQQAFTGIDFLQNARALVDLLRRYSFPEDRFGAFFAHKSLLALRVPAESFASITFALEQSLGFSTEQMTKVICYRRGLDFLEVAQRCDARHVSQIFNTLSAKYGDFEARVMVSTHPGFLRLTTTWLQESLSSLKFLLPVEHLKLGEVSHGAILLVSPRTRKDAFEFYRKHVYDDNSEKTCVAIVRNWRLLSSTKETLIRAFSALVDLLGQKEVKRVLSERPILLVRLNPDTVKVLLDLGYDVRSIVSHGQVSVVLGFNTIFVKNVGILILYHEWRYKNSPPWAWYK